MFWNFKKKRWKQKLPSHPTDFVPPYNHVNKITVAVVAVRQEDGFLSLVFSHSVSETPTLKALEGLDVCWFFQQFPKKTDSNVTKHVGSFVKLPLNPKVTVQAKIKRGAEWPTSHLRESAGCPTAGWNHCSSWKILKVVGWWYQWYQLPQKPQLVIVSSFELWTILGSTPCYNFSNHVLVPELTKVVSHKRP